MINPFELHPDDQKRMLSAKKLGTIKIEEVKRILNFQLEKIKEENVPLWGYNNKHIDLFFNDLISEIEKATGEKNDS